MTRTYIHNCLKEGLVVRWPDSAMPIKVYIAPFRWYEKSKQQESHVYHQMILEAFRFWSEVTGGKIRFQIVNNLNQSQIDINWRRVDRKSLGHCEYMINDRAMIYSAEIRIGISDGLVHARYNDADEVRHTILHEIGHALGLLGHSDQPGDIMYVPHQYGLVDLSERDKETLNWLYKLPVGFDYVAMGKKHQLTEPFTIHDVLELIETGKTPKKPPSDFLEKIQPKPIAENPEKLAYHHDILSARGKHLISTQNIQISPDIKKRFIIQRRLKNEE